jgi:TonB family protein
VAILITFIIPLIQAGWVKNLFITQEIKYTVYSTPIMISHFSPVENATLNIGQILGVVYVAGVIVLFGRLIVQLVALNRIIKKDQHDTAYSFFKKVKLPDEVKDNNIVAVHEQVHARQLHSVDVFVIEAVMIVNWFNPVVYFYRRAIKHVHEFIADDHAIEAANNRADYAMLLLTQTFEAPTHNLVNHFFNHSLLKQRIIMLQKNKSERVKLLKYGLSAPLFVLMLVLSSATVNNSKTVKAINNKITQVLLLPPTPISSITKLSVESSNSEPATMKILAKTQERTAETLTATDVTDTVIKNDSQVFAAVEIQPEFIGGQQKFSEFIAENIKYPQDMIANNISGKAIVTFIVEPDGSLSNIKVLKAPTESAGDEARRVIALSPKWSRGIQNGRSVRVQFTIPVAFNISANVTGNNATPDTSKEQNNIGLTTTPPPLYIVDGEEIKPGDVKSIAPGTINSMYVLNGRAAIAQYGEKGAHGVVVIYLKGYKGPLPASATKG